MTDPTAPSYTAQALRTESPITPALQTRLQQQARLVHAVLGLQTEAGELADPVKKHIYYGRPLDPVNLREEIGDCLWYLAVACDALGTTLEAEQARNLAKLRARYPHVFTAEAAHVRDLDRERQVLEGNDLGTLLEQSQRVVSDAFSEVNSLRQQLDAARAEIETLRQELASAKRAASDEFTERQVLTVEQQQDAAIWQQQLDAARAEIETLKGAMAADDKRLRDAEQRVWPGMTWGCDSPDKMADAILHLRKQLAEQQAETIDVRRPRNNETDRLNATNAVSVQQRDEIAYLRTRLDEERSVSAGVRDKLTSAEAAVTLQRAGIERLQAFVGMVRELLATPLAQISYDDMSVVRAEFAALDDEPTPVAKPEGGK
ncbi:MAG: MazG nucleotide pyrophosphohydrolase domain-containing protein [Planctomycetaceae bacterium]